VKGVVLRGRSTVIKLYFTEDGVLESTFLIWRLPPSPAPLQSDCDADWDLPDVCFEWFMLIAQRALESEEEVEVVEL
jgi:hypothetical protein